ncbi:CoA transferase subunit A [Actinomadura sp. NBRC 104412]|uniref:CoA transferase subunit A n=1 Tax=Actinomadura sp. NBRC 104412 TaxID=3032203 RepID=UPI0024A58A53|nr:CoA-transferase [Actinomadura sp. NBRC 104412]GLZ02593.1 CoA transferase subunit A [Actinomadura sp. NBRC 104412]
MSVPSPASPIKSKVMTPDEAVAVIEDGATVAVGGAHSHNNPMALVYALVRKGVRDLTVIPTPSAGLAVDVLVAAGCVSRLHVSYVGLEFLGFAPNFRRAGERKEIEIIEADEAWIVFGLRGGAARLPFVALPPLYEGTDLPKVNPLIRSTTDPYTGGTVTTIPALRADACLVHGQVADQRGNVQIFGQRRFEDLMAKASDHVIVSVDEILDPSAPSPDPRHVSIPGAIVEAVAHAPYGAHPTSSPGHYDYDREALVAYRDLAAREQTGSWLDSHVRQVDGQLGYLEKVGLRRLLDLKQSMW